MGGLSCLKKGGIWVRSTLLASAVQWGSAGLLAKRKMLTCTIVFKVPSATQDKIQTLLPGV